MGKYHVRLRIPRMFITHIQRQVLDAVTVIYLQVLEQFPRWEAISAIDIISDVAVLFYPIRFLRKLHLSKQKKILLLVVFESRVL
jgi:hypothetical protein